MKIQGKMLDLPFLHSFFSAKVLQNYLVVGASPFPVHYHSCNGVRSLL